MVMEMFLISQQKRRNGYGVVTAVCAGDPSLVLCPARHSDSNLPSRWASSIVTRNQGWFDGPHTLGLDRRDFWRWQRSGHVALQRLWAPRPGDGAHSMAGYNHFMAKLPPLWRPQKTAKATLSPATYWLSGRHATGSLHATSRGLSL